MSKLKTYQERMSKIKIKFTKVDEGFYRAETLVKPFDSNKKEIYYPIALINQLPYGNKYWQVEYRNKYLVDNQGYNCFSFRIAKQLIKDKVNNDYDLYSAIHNEGYTI